MNLEDEIAETLSREIAQEIDFELLTDMLIACGWHRVTLTLSFNRKRQVDILDWCESTAQGKFKHHSNTFIFEHQGDAVNFALRWS
jgi:hypothetical protein